MRLIILAAAAISALAIPTSDVAPVKGVVSVAADVLANADAAVANVGVKGSNVADNVGNDNHVDVLPRDLVTVGALIEALANALAQADVSLKAVLANVKVQDSSILTNILNDNKITVLRRDGVPLPANIDAIVLAFINALIAAGVNVQAALANIGIDQSTLLSNIGNNNVIFIRSLPELVDIVALVTALANVAAKAGVNVNAVIANLNIDNSSILTDILNGNTIILRRDLGIPLINADVLTVLTAIVTAALNANVDVFATALNAGLDSATILSNILNNNSVTILPIFLRRDASALDIFSTVLALVQALVAIGVPVDIFALNAFIQNSNIATNILNNNIISILGI